MPENHLPHRQKKTLPGVVHRSVCRMEIYVEGFKVHPHRVRGISQPPVGECVSQQQVAEIVVDRRFWNRQYGQQGSAQRESQEPY